MEYDETEYSKLLVRGGSNMKYDKAKYIVVCKRTIQHPGGGSRTWILANECELLHLASPPVGANTRFS